MKAVLEFAYPDDEEKLKHAMNAEKYYDTLCEIDGILTTPYTKAEAYGKIKKVIDELMDDVA